jgi:hypothetical protein
MSLIGTKFIGSARGYGYGTKGTTSVSSGSGSITFGTGRQYWTAPAGVTNLLTVTGKGANGSAGTWSQTFTNIISTLFFNYNSSGTFVNGPYTNQSLTFNDLWLDGVDVFNLRVSKITGTSPETSNQLTFNDGVHHNWAANSINQPNLLARQDSSYGDSQYWWYKSNPILVRDPAYIWEGNTKTVMGAFTDPNFNTITQNITTSGIYSFYAPAASYTTVFGLSFPGGTSGTPYISPTNATETVYTNVAVDPGTTYTINNYGSLTITW